MPLFCVSDVAAGHLCTQEAAGKESWHQLNPYSGLAMLPFILALTPVRKRTLGGDQQLPWLKCSRQRKWLQKFLSLPCWHDWEVKARRPRALCGLGKKLAGPCCDFQALAFLPSWVSSSISWPIKIIIYDFIGIRASILVLHIKTCFWPRSSFFFFWS